MCLNETIKKIKLKRGAIIIQRDLEFSAGWRTPCRPEAIIQATVGQRLCLVSTNTRSLSCDYIRGSRDCSLVAAQTHTHSQCCFCE